jgi:hypothetical protein
MANMSTRNQKIYLNYLLILSFAIVAGLFFYGLYKVWVNDFQTEDISRISVRIAFSIIIIWLMIFIPYLAWAVYFYNINLGKTNEEWEAIKRINSEREEGKEEIIPTNPYGGETFGLPKGTIRGSLAITLMVGALSLFVVAIGHPTVLAENQFFHENFEFFKTAFLMMIAFYFGSKGLEYLQSQQEKKTKPNDADEDAGTSPPNPKPDGTDNTFTDGGKPSSSDSPSDQTFSLVGLRQKLEESFDNDDTEADDSTIDDEPQKSIQSLLSAPQADMKEKQKSLTDEDIEDAAAKMNVEEAAIRAVIAVESAGKGFLPDGRPRILFEGHVFWKQLEDKPQLRAKLAANHPSIVYPKWTKQFYKGGAAEYERFKIAELADDDAAKKSTSWGLFQIMGFNHKVCGYDTVDEFVDKMSTSEGEQLLAFMNFCKHNGLIADLQNKNWANFAMKYNGKGYKQNQYDYKLEMKYNEYSKEHGQVLEARLVRQAQNEKQTEGTLTVFDKTSNTSIFTCKTLELPWKNNQRNVSCIPPGTYQVQKRWTQDRQNHFHLLNVPNRSFILIHSGNYYSHTLGCILVGEDLTDINSDKFKDVVQSKVTLAKLNEILPKSFSITIQ